MSNGANPVPFDGARVLVVGGSAGIGREAGIIALRRGAHVAFGARRAAVLDEIVRDEKRGHAVALDICDEASIARALDDAVGALGGLDAVVHTAGMARIGRLADQGASEWREVFDTNVIGAALVARAAIPHLAPGSGVMLFCSSTTDTQPRWGLSAYGVSKVALNRLIECLRAEHEDVRFVRATVGSTVGTDFASNFDEAALNEAFPEWIVRAQHDRRLMTVADVASVLVDVVGMLLARPDVDIPSINVVPPGGPMTLPPSPDVVAQVYGQPPAQ